MQLPGPCQRILAGILVPANRAEDVLSSVAVDITKGVAVPAAIVPKHDSADRWLAIRGLRQLPHNQRISLDPTVDDDLGHTVTV